MTVEPVIDITAAAQILGVPRSWIYARVEQEYCDVPHFRVGRYLRFRASELDAYLQENQGGPKR